MLSVKCQPEDT